MGMMVSGSEAFVIRDEETNSTRRIVGARILCFKLHLIQTCAWSFNKSFSKIDDDNNLRSLGILGQNCMLEAPGFSELYKVIPANPTLIYICFFTDEYMQKHRLYVGLEK